MSDTQAKEELLLAPELKVQSCINPEPLRPQFYLVRPDPSSTIVPLIPYDELPDIFRKLGLHGVPDTITTQHIHDWDMSRVHDLVPLRGSFDVENMNMMCLLDSPNQRSSVCERESLTSSSDEHETQHMLSADKASSEEKGSEHTEIENAKDINLAMLKIASQNKWEKDNDRSKTKDAMTAGVYGKKKYCTHWIRTGNCDYVQEGCRYEHVIPDRETMLSIGIRDIPRWHREELSRPAEGQSPKRGGNPPKMAAKAWRKMEHKSEKLAEQRQIKAKTSSREGQTIPNAAQAHSSQTYPCQDPPFTDAMRGLNIKESLDIAKTRQPDIMPFTGPPTSKAIDQCSRPQLHTLSVAANKAKLLNSDEIRAQSYPIEYPPTVSQGASHYAANGRDHHLSYLQPLPRFTSPDQHNLQVGSMPIHLHQFHNPTAAEQYSLSVRTPGPQYFSQNESSSSTPAFANGIQSSAAQSPVNGLEIHRTLAPSRASSNVYPGSSYPVDQSSQQAHYHSDPSPIGSTKMNIAPQGINSPGGIQSTYGAIGQGRPMYKDLAGAGQPTLPPTSPPIYHKRRFIGPNEPTHSRAHEPVVIKHGRHAHKGYEGNANPKNRGANTYIKPATYEEAAALANGYPLHRGHIDQDNLISLEHN